MTTEIIISEFTIRTRLKIGDLSEHITDKVKFGADVSTEVRDSTFLRYFLNAVNSNFNTWTEREKIKRIEIVSSLFNLNDKPFYSKDWLDRFSSINPIIKTGSTYIEIPKGIGYVFRDYNNLKLVGNSKIDITEL